MSSKYIALAVRKLSKNYILRHNQPKYNTLVDAITGRIKHPFRKSARETFWALNEVSFEIPCGEIVGIIGRNGAGKSTLLKILSRVTRPTSGEAELRGRVGSLLEVGTGFHQELSGRENIYLNGAILGMTRSFIRQQFDAIVDFSGVEKFLDTPVKRYSSGMYVRLAFSVAAHLHPDILLMDEVLSVGDAEFQRKCLGKISEVAHDGRTVLFVSHNMGLITQLCSTGVYLSQGQVAAVGSMDEVMGQYIKREIRAVDSNRGAIAHHHNHAEPLKFTNIRLVDNKGFPCTEVDVRAPFCIRVKYSIEEPLQHVEMSVRVCTADGRAVFTSHESDCSPQNVHFRAKGDYTVDVQLPAQFLMPGDYTVDLIAHRPNIQFLDHVEQALSFTVLETGSKAALYNRHQYLGAILIDLQWSYFSKEAISAS